jgi:hypothetical protein
VLSLSSGTPSPARGLRRESGREFEFAATNPQKQVPITTKLTTSAIAMKKRGKECSSDDQ